MIRVLNHSNWIGMIIEYEKLFSELFYVIYITQWFLNKILLGLSKKGPATPLVAPPHDAAWAAAW